MVSRSLSIRATFDITGVSPPPISLIILQAGTSLIYSMIDCFTLELPYEKYITSSTYLFCITHVLHSLCYFIPSSHYDKYIQFIFAPRGIRGLSRSVNLLGGRAINSWIN